MIQNVNPTQETTEGGETWEKKDGIDTLLKPCFFGLSYEMVWFRLFPRPTNMINKTTTVIGD